MSATTDSVALLKAAQSGNFTTLEELRKDKERLDWLDEHMTYVGGGSGGVYSFRTPADVEQGLLRQAIDAAMNQPAE